MDCDKIIKNMTLLEKAAFVTGKDYWSLNKLSRLGVPSIHLSDGPHGLRKRVTKNNTTGKLPMGKTAPATCFPTSATASCSFDEALIYEEGRAIAEECINENVSVLLAPGVNIKRSPLCGRNFEYYSEDPYLSGRCGAAFIKGVQSMGVGTALKHFACNSQEAFRMVVNEVVDERTLHEIYLTPFEICIKEAAPWCVMNSYNKVNGIHSSENPVLLQDILRDKWRFDGLVVTDWGASVDRVKGLISGTDLEMPGSGNLHYDEIINAVKDGVLDEAVLNWRVRNILSLIKKSTAAKKHRRGFDPSAHHDLARKVAESSAVLLKNDGILPLDKSLKIAVIGDMAKNPRYQGAGSSQVKPTKITCALDALVHLGFDVTYQQGYSRRGKLSKSLIKNAVNAAVKADIALVFVGLTEEIEAESYDRQDISLSPCHNLLVSEVAKAQKNTAVVLSGGSAVSMPWVDEVKAVLYTGLSGQAGGEAAANLLAGTVNPSGKLSETFPTKLEDTPTYGNFPSGPVTSVHREAIYVGYRYYDTAQKEVLFPFGHGLSYTEFEYSGLKLSAKSITEDDTLTLRFNLKNTGSTSGAEVTQVYIRDKDSTAYRPQKELRKFQKIFLESGEEKEVTLNLEKRDFSFFNTLTGDWCVESGEFEILVGASSRDIRLKETVNVTGTPQPIPDHRSTAYGYYTADISDIDDKSFEVIYGALIPKNATDTSIPIGANHTLGDCTHTKWGKRVLRLVKLFAGKGKDSESGTGYMMSAMMSQVPIRNFSAMSMGLFTADMTEGLLMILNDDTSTLKGFFKILRGVPRAVIRLPKFLKSI